MKKLYLITLTLVIIILSSSCGIREKLLAPPDEIEVPSGAIAATCTKDEIEYKYIYEGHVLYLYFIDNEEQSVELRDEVQELIIMSSESMDIFLDIYFPNDTCTISDYE